MAELVGRHLMKADQEVYMKDVIELFKSARRVSTPLVAISTSDQFALMRRLFRAVGNGDSAVPKLTWDIMRGLQAVNESAKAMLAQFDQTEVMGAGGSPPGMLALAERFEAGTVLVMFNAHRFIEDVSVAQGISNLRDVYCENRRTLVLVGPSFQLPAELQDVVLFDEQLPDDEQLASILVRTYEAAYDKTATVDPEWVDAVRGLSAFTAEQVFAMSAHKDGIDKNELWARKRAAINQTRGLRFVRGGAGFDGLGGLDSFKRFMSRLGKKPGIIVFMDEIDKSIAGARGDTTGVSQDFHGTLLSWMEDHFHDGMIAVGPPGSGKTAGGMAIGPSLGVPTIVLDINAMKGSLVGESERAIRDALKVVDSVAGPDGAFVFATCNSETQLAPEFKRRFRSGTWFFDLPTEEERDVIWSIHMAAHELVSGKPNDELWTGAEIRNCCDLAYRLESSLEEAAQYVVPVAKANPQAIEALRNAAFGKWLSASYPGPYRGVPGSEEKARGRKVQLSG